MNVVLWIIASLLAAVFLANGLLKLAQPKEKLAASAMTRWAEDFSPNAIKAMGTLQVAAAIGLTLPALLDIAPVFVPLAALGLAAMMIGAAIVHTRRHELPMLAPNLALAALAATVAWARFGPYAF
ncbi:DoxX-like protein [Kribbella sp. VKM Ac-2527]|uniref:DoxX-like protein n=1 Tax=Kribbella caucasensis TaxID=2512215 RepID=A0A4R6J4S3_9ACTN|nr:DoxX family protein [Kribbella sp. VKM Ac-2527]TDO29811.1 DoxX-like protein [Kribbella sp. VKM Ac-2527]